VVRRNTGRLARCYLRPARPPIAMRPARQKAGAEAKERRRAAEGTWIEGGRVAGATGHGDLCNRRKTMSRSGAYTLYTGRRRADGDCTPSCSWRSFCGGKRRIWLPPYYGRRSPLLPSSRNRHRIPQPSTTSVPHTGTYHRKYLSMSTAAGRRGIALIGSAEPVASAPTGGDDHSIL
jgi:hypothetical protein